MSEIPYLLFEYITITYEIAISKISFKFPNDPVSFFAHKYLIWLGLVLTCCWDEHSIDKSGRILVFKHNLTN